MAPMPAAQQPAMPPAQQSSGPGLMGTFASSAAGSVAGSRIANTLFSGRSNEAPAQVAPATGAAPAASGPVCTFETQQFLQCMGNTQDNMEQCTAFYDMFKQCQSQARH